jgi:hypothetical protein
MVRLDLIGLDGSPQLVRGVVDISSGYAMISTSTGCKAWNYVKVGENQPIPKGLSTDQISEPMHRPLAILSRLVHLLLRTPNRRLLSWPISSADPGSNLE